MALTTLSSPAPRGCRPWPDPEGRVDKKLTNRMEDKLDVLILYYSAYLLWSSLHRIGGTVSTNQEGPGRPVRHQRQAGKVRDIGGRGDRNGPVQG